MKIKDIWNHHIVIHGKSRWGKLNLGLTTRKNNNSSSIIPWKWKMGSWKKGAIFDFHDDLKRLCFTVKSSRFWLGQIRSNLPAFTCSTVVNRQVPKTLSKYSQDSYHPEIIQTSFRQNFGLTQKQCPIVSENNSANTYHKIRLVYVYIYTWISIYL